MPRQKLILSQTHPYHVVNSANNREWFPFDQDLMWEILSDELLFATYYSGASVHAFVLMANHFHLLISTPELDLGRVMQQILSSATRRLNRSSGRSGHVFNGPHFRSVIQDPRYYSHAFKYVYRNPVRAGIVHDVTDYRFSTLHGLVGASPLRVPLFNPADGAGDFSIPDVSDGLLTWLNHPTPKEADAAIRKAYRKSVFKLDLT